MDEIRGGLWSKYIEVDQVKTRLSVLLCILSSISVMPLCFDAFVCGARLFITWHHHKGYHQAAKRQPAHTMRLDRAISRHRKVGSQIAKVLGPGWRLKDNENMHDSWTWDETENGPSPCNMQRPGLPSRCRDYGHLLLKRKGATFVKGSLQRRTGMMIVGKPAAMCSTTYERVCTCVHVHVCRCEHSRARTCVCARV